MTNIGLINPGAMGASVGAAAARNEHSVMWAGRGRSDATRSRADKAGLKDCDTLEQLVSQSEIILSVCPPASATGVANDVLQAEFAGLYVDANAISPDRTRSIAAQVTAAGARFVDGGIIGGPAWDRASGTTLHLSGTDAGLIADLFRDSPLHTNVISDVIGAASALKMVFAAYSKGSTALLAAILGVAEKEGVRDQLARQWGNEFSDQTHRRVAVNTAKAWRFVGEMEEIAATFNGAGLPNGFHLAAADVFARMSDFKDSPTPSIEEILDKLLQTSGGAKP